LWLSNLFRSGPQDNAIPLLFMEPVYISPPPDRASFPQDAPSVSRHGLDCDQAAEQA
jgi:hypothetical protein